MMRIQRWAGRGALLLLAASLAGCASSPLGAEIASRHEAAMASIRNLKARLAPVSGDLKRLKTEVEVIEYRDGDDPHPHKRPGKVKYKNLVLKRTSDRKSGSVVQSDR